MSMSRGKRREQVGRRRALQTVSIMSLVWLRPPKGPKYFAPSFAVRLQSVKRGYSLLTSRRING